MLLLAAPARGDEPDPRGWKQGVPAANAQTVLEPRAEQPVIALPKELDKLVTGPTAIVYFSPMCPHCQHAQPELNALSARLGDKGKLVGIASGAASKLAMEEYRTEREVPYPLVYDGDREISAAMGIRSTPSVLLVDRQKKDVVVLDAFYPYVPGYDTIIEMRLSKDPWSAFRPGEYHGNAACAACHVNEADAWQLTHHAIAWRSLVLDRKEDDDACTGCHVTGAGQPGGWSGDPHSPLVDVGCEACHGPGGPHDGATADPKETCAGCHDAKHSIDFSYAKGLPLIDHYLGVDLDDATYLARRKELAEGTAPRPLLAFSAGEQVGAAACKECHAEQYAAWEASPHATAMRTLEQHEGEPKDAVGTVECVRCHATATTSGPPPETLAGYRAGESVSCESCHGPGAAHAAAGGGTDNIQALGESCPVCVLEAVCTSCHTKQWDPGWKLTEKLEKVKH